LPGLQVASSSTRPIRFQAAQLEFHFTGHVGDQLDDFLAAVVADEEGRQPALFES